MALRISAAATLALVITLAIPYHPEYWFGWFAPFSVIIAMLMFPYQNKNHAIYWERFIGVSMGIIVALVLMVLLGHNVLLYSCAIFIFCLYCMYQVGNHHFYHYGFFLTMIFAVLTIAFKLMGPQFVDALWQFPVTVLIALFSLGIIDWLLPPHTAKNLLSDMKSDAVKLCFETNITDTLDLAYFKNWHKHITQTKSQMSAKLHSDELQISHLLRLIAYKHNLIAEHFAKIENAGVAAKIQECFKKIHHKHTQSYNFDDGLKAIKDLQQYLEKADPKNENALICLNELTLINEDINDMHALENNEAFATNPPTLLSKHHFGFNFSALMFSSKTMIAIFISIALVFSFHLPGGVQTIIATIVTAAAPNTGAAILKMLMRASGIILGTLCGFGLILIIAGTHSLPLYLGLSALFFFFAAKWSIKSKHHGYAGIQAALLFLIMVSNTGSSVIDMALSTERLEGVFIGSFIAFIIVLILSPTKPNNLLRAKYQMIQDKLQATWLILQRNTPNKEEARTHLAEAEQLIGEASQIAHEGHFLMAKSVHHENKIKDIQAITDMLKQLTRLISTSKQNQISAQKLLAKIKLNFSTILERESFVIDDEALDSATAKTKYALKHIQKHWQQYTCNTQG